MNRKVTPIQEIDLIEDNRLFLKRDDLYPYFFGGNKVRIAEEFFLDMTLKKKNCIIGYGNARSNMSRAIANIAFSRNIPCYIISPDDDDGTRIETSNSRIVRDCNAIIRNCKKESVSQTVEVVFEECYSRGYDPYYIYGNQYGKGNEAVQLKAYEKVYKEIITQSSYKYDYIFLATGTGMTQAGLICGRLKYQGVEDIIGISIAREAKFEEKVILSYLESGGTTEKTGVLVDDSYIMGGYGKYNYEITNTIRGVYKKYGIPLDPIYTGKAFYGMRQWIKKNGVRGKTILFIHTGGTPLFFDYLNTKHLLIEKCHDKDKLSSFLKKVDLELPTSLSKRVDIDDYSSKVLQHGNAFVIQVNNEILAAGLFYCNNHEKKQGYLTLLVSSKKRKGYASAIMDDVEEYSKLSGMEYMLLDTENSNKNAINFYIKRNYEIVSIHDRTKMRKKL